MRQARLKKEISAVSLIERCLFYTKVTISLGHFTEFVVGSGPCSEGLSPGSP